MRLSQVDSNTPLKLVFWRSLASGYFQPITIHVSDDAVTTANCSCRILGRASASANAHRQRQRLSSCVGGATGAHSPSLRNGQIETSHSVTILMHRMNGSECTQNIFCDFCHNKTIYLMDTYKIVQITFISGVKSK